MYRFNIQWNGVVGLATTSFYVAGDPAAPDPAEAQALHDRVVAFFTSIKGLLPSSVSLSSSATVDVIQQQSGQLLNTVPVTPGAGIVGSGVSTFSAPSGALLRLNTGQFVNGRVVKGHIFLVPMATTVYNADGGISASTLSTVNAAAATLIGSGSGIAVWHRPKAGAGGLAVPVVSASTSPIVAVLTSRRD